MADNTQMLKGILEGCILNIVNQKETYGYEICETLMQYGFEDVTEGSVYPILIRLEKKKELYSVMKKSPLGPMRKYYYLTEDGEKSLEQFNSMWEKIKKNVDGVLGV